MAKLDSGRLIRQTRELVVESKKLHESSRRTTEQSRTLKERLLQRFPSCARRAAPAAPAASAENTPLRSPPDITRNLPPHTLYHSRIGTLSREYVQIITECTYQ